MEASPVIKLPLFLGGLFLILHRSRRSSCLWLAFFLALSLHFAAATAARTFVSAAAALVTTTTAAFATAALAAAAHRPTAVATATMREHAAEATAERATMATTARLTAAVAALFARIAATAAAVASKPESIGTARNGQHGHDQGNTLKVHLPISIRVHVRRPMTSAVWRTGESPACSTSVGRDTCAGKRAAFEAPVVPVEAKMPVMTAGSPSWVPRATSQNRRTGALPQAPFH